jgi:hypothetical protein
MAHSGGHMHATHGGTHMAHASGADYSADQLNAQSLMSAQSGHDYTVGAPVAPRPGTKM